MPSGVRTETTGQALRRALGIGNLGGWSNITLYDYGTAFGAELFADLNIFTNGDQSDVKPGMTCAPLKNTDAPAVGELILTVDPGTKTWEEVHGEVTSALEAVLGLRFLRFLLLQKNSDAPAVGELILTVDPGTKTWDEVHGEVTSALEAVLGRSTRDYSVSSRLGPRQDGDCLVVVHTREVVDFYANSGVGLTMVNAIAGGGDDGELTVDVQRKVSTKLMVWLSIDRNRRAFEEYLQRHLDGGPLMVPPVHPHGSVVSFLRVWAPFVPLLDQILRDKERSVMVENFTIISGEETDLMYLGNKVKIMGNVGMTRHLFHMGHLVGTSRVDFTEERPDMPRVSIGYVPDPLALDLLNIPFSQKAIWVLNTTTTGDHPGLPPEIASVADQDFATADPNQLQKFRKTFYFTSTAKSLRAHGLQNDSILHVDYGRIQETGRRDFLLAALGNALRRAASKGDATGQLIVIPFAQFLPKDTFEPERRELFHLIYFLLEYRARTKCGFDVLLLFHDHEMFAEFCEYARGAVALGMDRNAGDVPNLGPGDMHNLREMKFPLPVVETVNFGLVTDENLVVEELKEISSRISAVEIIPIKGDTSFGRLGEKLGPLMMRNGVRCSVKIDQRGQPSLTVAGVPERVGEAELRRLIDGAIVACRPPSEQQIPYCSSPITANTPRNLDRSSVSFSSMEDSIAEDKQSRVQVALINMKEIVDKVYASGWKTDASRVEQRLVVQSDLTAYDARSLTLDPRDDPAAAVVLVRDKSSAQKRGTADGQDGGSTAMRQHPARAVPAADWARWPGR